MLTLPPGNQASPLILNRQFIQRCLLVIVAYYVAARFGLATPSVGNAITLIWLPTGIAVAACLRWGWHMAAPVWISAFLVNLGVSGSPLLAASIAIGNTLGPLLSACLLHRAQLDNEFRHRRDVLLLILAAMLGMLLSATCGIAMLRLADILPSSELGLAWRIWWLGDTVGVLVATPLLLSLNRRTLAELKQHPVEVTFFFLLTGLASWAIFLSPLGRYSVGFLPLPIAMWASLRFGMTGASLAVLLMSVIAAWGTATGTGPFSSLDHDESLLVLWTFITALVVVNLIVTALLAESRRNAAELRLHSLILQNMNEGVQLLRVSDAVIVFTNPTLDAIFGYERGELLGQHVSVLNAASDITPQEVAARIILALSATGDWEGEINNRRKDGTTFWTKTRISGFDHPELGPVWVCVQADITEQKAATSKIQFLAFYDPLTELANRRLLMERLRHLAPAGKRTHHHAAVLFLDLDYFKQLNDSYGHRMGDLLLIEVAKRLRSCVREADTVARLGGDEFVVLLPELSTNYEQARHDCLVVAEKIREALSQPYNLEDICYECSSSVGGAIVLERNIDPEQLMQHADSAMYLAKSSGRNRICLHEDAHSLARQRR